MKTDAKVLSVITELDRKACEILLDAHGFAVYDSEPTYELREAIEANYKDGTIDGAEIVMEWTDSA